MLVTLWVYYVKIAQILNHLKNSKAKGGEMKTFVTLALPGRIVQYLAVPAPYVDWNKWEMASQEKRGLMLKPCYDCGVAVPLQKVSSARGKKLDVSDPILVAYIIIELDMWYGNAYPTMRIVHKPEYHTVDINW